MIKGSRTVVQAKLTDLTIEDLTENTLYSKVFFKFIRVEINVNLCTKGLIYLILKHIIILLCEIFSIFCQILTIEDDKVFDLKFTRYTKPKAKYPEAPKLSTVDSSIRLRIGRMQSILLYRFISEANVS